MFFFQIVLLETVLLCEALSDPTEHWTFLFHVSNCNVMTFAGCMCFFSIARCVIRFVVASFALGFVIVPFCFLFL